MKRIASFRDTLNEAAVGGKFSRQQVMARGGLPIPPFFCLTTACYDELTTSLARDLEAELAGVRATEPDAVAAASASIRARFAELRFDDALEREIYASFDEAFSPDAQVAVRASMVGHSLHESEDSASHAFAGMSDSFLFVRRDQLLDTIRRCMSSGFSAEAILYRLAQGLSPLGFSVAVGVQAMVHGERSFVLFTCDPKTAARDAVLVAGYGLGEGVVQERVAVDHYFVAHRDGAISRTLANKAEQVVYDRERGFGVTVVPVPDKLREAPCLTDDEIRRLVADGRTIEELFGEPQDIEGTITADGTIHYLQARPIALDYRRQRVWTNANVTESFPGVTTALTYSFARFFYREIFFDCYRRLGIPPETLRRNLPALDRMIGLLGGRIYYCLTSFYHLHSQSPLFPLFRAHWEKMMGFRSSYQTAAPTALGRAWQKLRGVGSTGAAVVNLAYNYTTHERQIRAFHAWWEELIAPLRGERFEDEDPLVLVGEFHRVWNEVGVHWGVTLLNDTYLPMLYGYTEKLFERWGLAKDEALLSDLLCGDEELLSVEIVLSAVALAERAREDRELHACLTSLEPEEVWRRLGAGELQPAWSEAVRAHLDRFGDRGLQELKMEQPNLRHTPWRLIQTIAGYARSDVSVASIRSHERRVRAEAEARLEEKLRGRPAQLALLRQLLAALRRLIRNRENSRFCRSELFGFSKNVFYALGRHLHAAGVLRTADDVVHLTQAEIFGYIDGTGVTEDLQALADVRRGEFDRHQQAQTAEQITTLGPVRINALTVRPRDDELDDAGELRGLGSSAGRVRGIAHVVLDPNDAVAVTGDMILVARETDPGWMFLMLAARGIVVERGSMLSHTAITGRKFGIPTVVGVPRATERIPDGARLEIDGASGVVTILSDEEPERTAAPASVPA
jgi:rifampicin phosphotransferase